MQIGRGTSLAFIIFEHLKKYIYYPQPNSDGLLQQHHLALAEKKSAAWRDTSELYMSFSH